MDSSVRDLTDAANRDQALLRWSIVPYIRISNREWKRSRLFLTVDTSFVGMDGWITAMSSSGFYSCVTIALTSRLLWLLTRNGALIFCQRSLETSPFRCGIHSPGLCCWLVISLDHARSTITRITSGSSGRLTWLHYWNSLTFPWKSTMSTLPVSCPVFPNRD